MGEYESFDIKTETLIPAIVDKETFVAAQLRLAKNQTSGGRNKAKYNYRLSGKIKCGQCGRAMCGNYAGISKKNNTIRCYYSCQGRKEKNHRVRGVVCQRISPKMPKREKTADTKKK